MGDQRYTGFRDALRASSVALRPELVLEGNIDPAHGYRSGFEITRRMLAGKVIPDGIVAYTDLLALGAIDATLGAGWHVPKHIQLVGCGNDPSLCDNRIPLTSMDLAGREIGKRTARLILKTLSQGSNSSGRGILVSPRIVYRASTQKTRT